MSFIARVYCDDRIYSLDLIRKGRITIGSDDNDALKIVAHKLRKGHITFEESNGTYTIKAKNMYNCENSPISFDKIDIGKTYSIDCEPEIDISIHPKQADGSRALGLDSIREIYIGRGKENNIILRNKRTSSNHCKIYREDGLLKIRDLRSSNGTFVNGKRVNEKTLVNGDVINISIYKLVIEHNTITFYNVGDDLEFNLEETKKGTDGGTMSIFDINIDVRNENEEYGIHIQKKNKNGTKSVFDID